MTTKSLTFENASIVTPSGVLRGASLMVEDGFISTIREGAINSHGKRVDAKGGYLLPGFIDLHSDAVEKEIEPRPNVFFPVNVAIYELDKKLAAAGVTTIFHALSFAEGEVGVRSNEMAAKIITEITRLSPKFSVKTMVHARFEITDADAVPYLEELLAAGKIHLLSLMDHTPGQGQFREVAAFKDYFRHVYKKSDEDLNKIIDRKMMAKERSQAYIGDVIELCKSLKIPLASHDDDSTEKIRWLDEMKIMISEFPVTLEAVRAAKTHDIQVCLGSPNVLRGNSQAKNLSAQDAIAAGFGEILCSDYSPMTMVHAVFALYDRGTLPLHQAVNMASINPAKAVGISGRTGSLEENKIADIIVVDMNHEIPKIVKTFAAGHEAYSAC